MATGNWVYKVCDISSWVTIYPGFFGNLQAMGYSGVCCRLGAGSSKDLKVDAFRQQCRAETNDDFKFGVYFVPNPLYSVAVNLNYFVNFLGSSEVDFIAGDYERTFGISYPAYLTFMVGFQKALMARYPDHFHLVYSAKWFMDNLGTHPDFLTWLWWVAVYYAETSLWPPEVQKPWAIPRQISMSQVGLWQFYNKWRENYSGSQLDANVGWIELAELFTEPPAEIPSSAERIVTVIAQPYLNIRRTPSPEGEDLGNLCPGTTVTVDEQSGNFLRIVSGWIHKDFVR